MAREIDLEKSKGIDQEVIASIYPQPMDREVAEDAIIKIIFDVALDSKHIKKNDIKLTDLSDVRKKIEGEIIYLSDEQAVTFKPKQVLEVGYYEIEIKSLKPIKEEKDKKIKEIKYHFYVPEVINGYMLPIEPDEKINNSTLLGIDSNDNGVRDDVERYILKTYEDHHKIVIEIGFQRSRSYQNMLNNPLDWEENHKSITAGMDCNFYFKSYAQYFGEHILIDHVIDLRDIQLNTKSRTRAYLTYDRQLSGGVYPLTDIDKQREKCAFDVDALLGGEL